jgi:hypothetical protein
MQLKHNSKYEIENTAQANGACEFNFFNHMYIVACMFKLLCYCIIIDGARSRATEELPPQLVYI